QSTHHLILCSYSSVSLIFSTYTLSLHDALPIFFSSISGFFAYLVAQVFLLKNLVIFDVAFCFLYVLYILLLPLEIKTIPLMIMAFLLGFSIDIFYDSLGMHTASLLAMAFIRNTWIGMIVPTGGYDENVQLSVLNMGIGWFLTYSLPLIFLHHLIFF